MIDRLTSEPHIRLVPATRTLVEDEMRGGGEEVAAALGSCLAEDWPPEHHDGALLAFTRDRLGEGDHQQGWWLHYVVAGLVDRATLVGTCGFKGPPAGGIVEIGYSIVPSWRGRGAGTAVVSQLVDLVRRREPGLRMVVADTLPHLESSIGVLRRNGFTLTEPVEPRQLRFALDLGVAPPRT